MGKRVLTYSVLLGGGSVALVWFLPERLRLVGVGNLLLAGVVIAAWAAVTDDDRTADSDGGATRSVAGGFYAAGLLVFGALTLVWLL